MLDRIARHVVDTPTTIARRRAAASRPPVAVRQGHRVRSALLCALASRARSSVGTRLSAGPNVRGRATVPALRWAGVHEGGDRAADQDKPATSHAGKASALAFADTPRIQFTKTPDDAEPDDLADRRIWRLGLTLKDAAFAHTDRPFYAHRGSGTIFVRNGVSSPSDVTAHLVHASERDSYVTITSIGVARAEIVRVLGSIRPKERKRRA